MTEKNIVGIFDNTIPVEIFHAGHLSTVWLPDFIGHSTSGIDYLPTQSCLFCRIAEKQVDQLPKNFFGVVFASSCTAMEKLYEVFMSKSNMKFIEIVDLPKVVNEASIHFYKERLKDLVMKMKTLYGLRIEAESLNEAIKLNNRLRGILREKKQYRSFLLKGDPLSFTNLKEKIRYVEACEEEQCSDRPRLLILGTRIEEDTLARAIEEEGACVATFLTDNGFPYNNFTVDENAKDPFESLARGYLDIFKGRRTATELPDIKMLRELIERENVDGIVSLSYPFCAKMVYDIAWVRRHRETLGVPMLNLQIDNNSMVSAGLKNRISAFIEIIETKKGKCT